MSGHDQLTPGWWAVDVAGYLLTRIEALLSPVKPHELDPDTVIEWIRAKEVDWAPGSADLRSQVPWDELRACADDAELLDLVMSRAGEEIAAALGNNGPDDLCPTLSRRFLSLSTLAAFSVSVESAEPGPLHADGHVHQGAALPIDLTLHWAARQMAGLDRNEEAEIELVMKDADDRPFSPLPLLLLLRALTETAEKCEGPEVLVLAGRAAEGEPDAWDELNRLLGFSEQGAAAAPTLAELVELKKVARSPGWSPQRRTALFRVEAILHGGVTQRAPGLDVFVDQFEQLSQIRRGRLQKDAYFARSIGTHSDRSGHALRRLELRLGEPIAGVPASKGKVQADYKAALAGYLAHIEGQDGDPIRVTFPWGLVKSANGKGSPALHWRFNPRGIYELTEVIIDLLSSHPSLARFVDGIDVCGEEEGEPNWLFAPAFKRFAEATRGISPTPACRFHAGESQWTPLHGLRRIAEFLRFELPDRTPRRIGHGLALNSNDWRRLGKQPVDELFDDLLWVHERLPEIAAVPSATARMVERLILELRPLVYEQEVAREASIPSLISAYGARFDTEALIDISFLEREGERLSFPDREPAGRLQLEAQLLTAHLGPRSPLPALAEVIAETPALPGITLPRLQAMLVDLYEILAPEVISDVRWQSVVVEACPTSNVMVGGVRGYDRHPMRDLVDQGILTTISSDDPSILHSWVPEELDHAERRMGVSPRQIRSSRELGLRLIAPGLDSTDISAELEKAIESLERDRVLD